MNKETLKKLFVIGVLISTISMLMRFSYGMYFGFDYEPNEPIKTLGTLEHQLAALRFQLAINIAKALSSIFWDMLFFLIMFNYLFMEKEKEPEFDFEKTNN